VLSRKILPLLIAGSFCLGVAIAAEPAVKESPLAKAKRLAVSAKRKDRIQALRWLKALAQPGTTSGDEATYRYAGLCLRFHAEGEKTAIKEARAAFEKLAKSAGSRYGLRGEIGLWRVLALEGKRKQAIRGLDRFLGRQTKCERAVEAAYFLGCIYSAAGKKTELADLKNAQRSLSYSLKLYAAVAKYTPPVIAKKAIKARLAGVKRRISEIKAGKLKVLFGKAEKLRKAKKFDVAINIYSEIIKESPKHVIAQHSQLRVGECLFALKKYNKAKLHLEGFIKEQPLGAYRGHAHLALGGFLLEVIFDSGRAERHFKAVIDGCGNGSGGEKAARLRAHDTWSQVAAAAHMRYGLCRYMARDFKTAGKHFERELALCPSQRFGAATIPSHTRFLVKMCRERKYPVLFSGSVMVGDRRVQTLVFLACAYAEAGKHHKALGLLERVEKDEFKVLLPAQRSYALYEKAAVLRLLMRDKDALKAFRHFLSKEHSGMPWAPKALLELASQYASLNQGDEAEGVYRTIAARYPNYRESATAMYNCGYQKFHKKEWKDCLAIFDALSRRFPNSWEGKRVARVELPYVRKMMRKERAGRPSPRKKGG
jgi:tetratricopeptide (TPR) repeat protein